MTAISKSDYTDVDLLCEKYEKVFALEPRDHDSIRARALDAKDCLGCAEKATY